MLALLGSGAARRHGPDGAKDSLNMNAIHIPRQSRKPIVLVIDDTPAELALVTGLLKDHFQVSAVCSGDDALGLLSNMLVMPHVILLDLMMPGMHGYQVCQQLKADAATRDIPVVFLTGSDEEESREMGLHLGAVAYLSKRAPHHEWLETLARFTPPN
jgi:CheY-like chemotaxis protein